MTRPLQHLDGKKVIVSGIPKEYDDQGRACYVACQVWEFTEDLKVLTDPYISVDHLWMYSAGMARQVNMQRVYIGGEVITYDRRDGSWDYGVDSTLFNSLIPAVSTIDRALSLHPEIVPDLINRLEDLIDESYEQDAIPFHPDYSIKEIRQGITRWRGITSTRQFRRSAHRITRRQFRHAGLAPSRGFG